MRRLLLWTAALGVPATSCAGQQASRFQARVILTAPAKLGGCASGDLFPARPGDELAAVCADGGVYVAWRAEEDWASERVLGLPGEMVQCAIGDALPDAQGLEIVCAGSASGGEDSGGPGAAWVLVRGEDSWRSERIATDGALLHGVAIGDLDPHTSGPEVLLVGFTRRAWLAAHTADGWRVHEAATLPGPGKNAVIAGGRAIVACADGSLIALALTQDGTLATTVIDRAPAGYARLAAGDNSVLAARDDGGLVLVEDGRARVVYRGQGKLRGAVLADLDPDAPGTELATAGYDRRVVLLRRRGADFEPSELFQAEDRLHHLTAFRGPGGIGLAAVGYSGRLVVLEPLTR